jgi:hypothetical protein
MSKTDLKLILPSPSSWLDLTITKWKRDQRELFHGGDIIFALMSPSEKKGHHVVADEVADPRRVARQEKEEINPQYQETLHGKTLTLRTRSTRKLIKNDGSPLPPTSSKMLEGEGRETSGGGRRGWRRC